jgi:hypothetical protein
MPFAQYYESSVIDRELGVGIRVVSLPASVVGQARNLTIFARDLGAVTLQPLAQPSGFVNAVALLLDMQHRPGVLVPTGERGQSSTASLREAFQLAVAGDIRLPDDTLAVAESLFDTASVPVERSPLSGPTFADLLLSKKKTKTWVVGAAVGAFAVAGQPLILVSVPVGIIVVMGAVSVGSFIQARVRRLANAEAGARPAPRTPWDQR